MPRSRTEGRRAGGLWLVPWCLAGCAREAWVLPPDAPLPLDEAVEAEVETLLDQLTLEEKLGQMAGASLLRSPGGTWDGPAVERLGVPPFRMIDGPRGVNTGVATAFPVAMQRAATWDPALETEVLDAIAREASTFGANVVLAPAMNLLLHPAYGRAQEIYGEESFLTERFAVAAVEGIERHAIAVPKHLAANNIEDTRFDVDAVLDERLLHEVYLPHFRAALREAGAGAVMSAYNRLNGTYCSEDPWLLTTLLRDGWGWNGVVISDFAFATYDAKRSIEAGLDVEMHYAKVYDDLPGLIESGLVDPALVDRSVRRVLRAKLGYGLAAREPAPEATVGSETHLELARRVAVEGLVLLENDATLPLAPGVQVDVLGPLADDPTTGDVGSSDVEAEGVVTVAGGLRAALGDAARHLPGGLPDDPRPVAVVVVGLTPEDEGENVPGRVGGDRETLALDPADVDLVEAAAEAYDDVIVVLRGGSAITTEGWRDRVSAVLWMGYGGQRAGEAVADVLLGTDPGGRLPFTVPVDEADLPPYDTDSTRVTYPATHGWRHLHRTGVAARYPFGHGLTYTARSVTLVGSDAVLEGPDGVLRVTVRLEGPAVAQLYVVADDPEVARHGPELVAFAKAREDAEIVLEVPAERLATWDPEADRWVIAPGRWTGWVGESAEDRAQGFAFEVR